MEGGRERIYSGNNQNLGDTALTVEDITVIKLMEEIIEFE